MVMQPPLTFDSPAFSVALAAVLQAARLCEAVRTTLGSGPGQSNPLGLQGQSSVATKDDASPVTIADYGAQALILRALGRHFPEIPAVGEEDGTDLATGAQAGLLGRVVAAVQVVEPDFSEAAILAEINRGNFAGGPQGRFWTLDPIDGTKGFLRQDQYAIALALIEDGQPILGILGCPALPLAMLGRERSGRDAVGVVVTALRGQGCRVFDAAGQFLGPARVSEVSEAAQLRFCESVESGHSRHDWAGSVVAALGVLAAPRRMDSQCKYALLATGVAEVYLRLPTRPGYQEKIWDHAAGCLCVTEAGGVVTDLSGQALDFGRGRTLARQEGIVATHGPLHDAVVSAVQRCRS